MIIEIILFLYLFSSNKTEIEIYPCQLQVNDFIMSKIHGVDTGLAIGHGLKFDRKP